MNPSTYRDPQSRGMDGWKTLPCGAQVHMDNGYPVRLRVPRKLYGHEVLASARYEVFDLCRFQVRTEHFIQHGDAYEGPLRLVGGRVEDA